MNKAEQPHKNFFSKHKVLTYYTILIGSLLWLFSNYLLFQDLYIFEDIGNDTLSSFYPSLLEMVRVFREEGIPLWSFSQGIGQSSFSTNIFNPFSWIYLIGGVENVAYLIGWVQFLKLLFTIFCAHHLFKLQGLSENAILLATTLLAFSGYLIVGSAWYGHSNNIMLMVVFLLGIELLFVKNQWWLIPISVVFLIGPRLLFIIEFAVIYTIVRFALMNKIHWNSVATLFKKLLLPISLGILFIAPFVGRTIYKYIYSPRVGGEQSNIDSLASKGFFELASSQEYTTSFFRLFSNDILGPANNFVGWKNYLEAPLFYCGLVTLLLLPQLFIFLKKKQRLVLGGVVLFWLLLLTLPFVRHAFYFFAGDYYKGAISLFFPLTLIILAGASFHYILKHHRINKFLLLSSLLILVSGLFLVPTASLNGPIDLTLRNACAVFLLVEALLLLGVQYFKKTDLSIILLIIVLFEGVFMSYQSMSERDDIPVSRYKSRSLYNDATMDVLSYIKRTDPGFFRIEKNFSTIMSGLNEGMAQGFFGTRSYQSHNHNNYIDFLNSMDLIDESQEFNTRWLMGFPQSNQLHPIFSIKYLIANQSTKSQVSSFFYEDIGEMGGLEIFKSKYYIPFGIPISKVSSNSDLNSLDTYFKKIQLHYLSVILADEDVAKYNTLERLNMDYVHGALAFEKYRNDYADKAMEITSFKQKEIEGNIKIENASIVFYSMPFDEGWRAQVNGKRRKLFRINNGLTGLYLEPGEYEIRLVYRPPYFRTGLILFAIGLVLFVILLLKKRIGSENTVEEALLPPDLV